MRFYFQLFWSFFKIGAFTFGGGYAMIPLIQKEVVNRKKWLEDEEFMDMLAIAQSVRLSLSGIKCGDVKVV